ncbi:thiol:disulfide interchange protein DsbA/DsbL [Ursidibacter maritimus]|uniref:Thiol:disulfide interchange protein DsbA/DsbL n=1 Tax=Ursidibacter maritimus TaxID=1331689 RepID=A0A949WQT1_9PAST|nr:thiol:disulfide interchange protein DsbA/DsbL [Ursidibacter maritimus]MBV6524261.1 thiol:disulfide interchange protein DsbA/DsbL [Ursidibacter maritimus]MBV6526528.1 thiol:disulfide interchange protein DsbA/DsbL [Ursidibacter maritimus]MBV6528396.1 thiol:disulfide interchange protein DsbA/DsbL [Ursidibacter maritimus]MBV6530295.1 thiol:disulfide interchange protein DsbA/DsbL [Ursidibacter maritimus]MBV6531620.1 thiol:disulfide interchange protein DsbA/DsbL [Ursidibacter maritimus]
MKYKIFLLCLLGLWLALPSKAENSRIFDKSANNKRLDFVGNLRKSQQNEPLFKDGKGYYSYKKTLDIPLPKDKVLIQYFYEYGCQICLDADDYLTAYAKRNSDKVALVRSPAFPKGSRFTAQLNATFTVIGRPDLSDKYLFDSAHTKNKRELVENNEAIRRWLTTNQLNIAQFHQTFESEPVKQLVEQAEKHYVQYEPPITPIAVLNGKYILIRNTLYNDDYTYAVLDFLVEKLQQEQQEKPQ